MSYEVGQVCIEVTSTLAKNNSTPRLIKSLTVGDIATELQISQSKASRTLARLGIDPIARAGFVRLFPPASLARCRKALAKR